MLSITARPCLHGLAGIDDSGLLGPLFHGRSLRIPDKQIIIRIQEWPSRESLSGWGKEPATSEPMIADVVPSKKEAIRGIHTYN